MRFACSALLIAICASACAEATREFSPPPTVTATSPAATTLAPRPVTAPPSTTAATTASAASPTATAAAATPTATVGTTSVPILPSPARTSSPTPASASSPQVTLPPGASLPPMPSQPPLAATQIASGTLTFAIAPGETRKFEPADLATTRGASPAPTTSYVWTIAWRATESLTASWYRDTSVTQLGRGRWGTADLGGAGFQLRNDTSATVYGELAYLIGSR